MALFKTSNPALSDKTFQGLSDSQFGGAIDTTARMTLQGTVNKTGFLMLLAIAGAAFTWNLFMQSHDASDPLCCPRAAGASVPFGTCRARLPSRSSSIRW